MPYGMRHAPAASCIKMLLFFSFAVLRSMPYLASLYRGNGKTGMRFDFVLEQKKKIVYYSIE